MKKLLLSLVTLSVATMGFAQDEAVGPKERKKFKIGFNLAPSVDFFQPSTEGISSESVGAKFSYGVMAEYAFTNNYALAFGLEHKMAGAALDFRDTDVRYFDQSDEADYQLASRKYAYDYLNLPIALKLMTNEIGYFTYFGQFGVDLSVLASARITDQRRSIDTTGADVAFGDLSSTESKGKYNQASFLNVRLRIGGGFEWNFSGNTSLVVSVSYHNGFLDLMRNPDAVQVNEDEGLYELDDTNQRVPFEMNARLHHVALNLGVLF